jgi:hypothetical protein
MRIEFKQPRPRVEDWRVTLGGRTVGSVWNAGPDYIVSVTPKERRPSREEAFQAARRQARSIGTSSRLTGART